MSLKKEGKYSYPLYLVHSFYCSSIDCSTIIFLKKIEEYEKGLELVYYCAKVDRCEDMSCIFRKTIAKYRKEE